MREVNFQKVDVDRFNIFYREAGSKDAPVSCCCMVFPAPAICSAT